MNSEYQVEIVDVENFDATIVEETNVEQLTLGKCVSDHGSTKIPSELEALGFDKLGLNIHLS